MRCHFCKSDTKVVDKRDSGAHTRRRRECLKCTKRFTTYERIESAPVTVIKKGGRRQELDRNKIKAGIIKACEKRPISTERIEQIVDEIERHVRHKFTSEIPSRAIGEAIMARLKALDNVAYIRFASVYRNFTDLGSFEKELKALKQEKLTEIK